VVGGRVGRAAAVCRRASDRHRDPAWCGAGPGPTPTCSAATCAAGSGGCEQCGKAAVSGVRGAAERTAWACRGDLRRVARATADLGSVMNCRVRHSIHDGQNE
jgi:hypothetical protein